MSSAGTLVLSVLLAVAGWLFFFGHVAPLMVMRYGSGCVRRALVTCPC